MKSVRIAIAARDPALATRLRAVLEAEQYPVVGAASDPDGLLRLAARYTPDLVLVEVDLGGPRGGLEAVARLRREHPVPVVFLADASNTEALAAAKAAEPAGFIRLPPDPDEVRTTVQLAFDQDWIERRLEESERRYRRLVESVTDYIYTVTVRDGHAVSTSHGPACQAVTGYTSAEYDADPNLWFNMVFEADRPRVLAQAAQLLKGEPCPPLEHRILHKDGRIRWIRNRTVPHVDAAGRLLSYDGLVTDITDRKQAELQTQEHARRLEFVNRIIMSVNRATDLTMLLDEVLREARTLIQFQGGCIFATDLARRTADLVAAVGLPDAYTDAMRRTRLDEPPWAGRLQTPGGTFIEDYAAVAPDRAARWGIRALALVPLIARERLIGALALLHDRPHAFDAETREILLAVGRQIGTAVEKIRSELALRENEDKYRTITEQSLIGIHMIQDGRLVFVNEGWTRITGYSRDEVARWPAEGYGALADPADRAEFLAQMRRLQLGDPDGLDPVRDVRFRARSGEPKWVLMHSRAVPFAEGRAVVGMLVDITDRKRAAEELAAANRQLRAREQELLAANRDKEALLKEVHHRVKNNLQVVTSLLKLQAGHVTDATAAAVLRECQNRIRSIALVHEKIYQSRNLAEVDVAAYLQSLLRHLSRSFPANPAAVAFDTAVDQVALPIDQAIPCSLIINELVSNSLKYAFPADRRGTIRIRLNSDGPGAFRLEIGDDGVGMPAGLDFRHTDTLGLQLVMTFVGQLGGSIEREPGPGTRFVVRFPAGKKTAPEPAPAAP